MPLLWLLEPSACCQTAQQSPVAGAVQPVQPALDARLGEQDRQIFELVKHGWHAAHSEVVLAAKSSVARGENPDEAGAAR